jgi:hypothetical protein
MKQHIQHFSMIRAIKRYALLVLCSLAFPLAALKAQTDSSSLAPATKKKSFTKNTFEGNYVIDNQTVMVPIKGTFEFLMQHRFGTWDKGFTDLFGIFGGAHIRLAANYAPMDRLQFGAGIYSENMVVDFNSKYAILKQTKDGSMPISLTWFGNVAMDTRKKDNSTLFITFADRLNFFNQLIVARKFTDKFSAQGSFNVTHFNNLEGYLDENGKVQPMYENTHLSFSLGGRYKVTDKMSIIANYDQPITQHPMNNPHPNLSGGIEIKTSGHCFQVFFANYNAILPQYNNLYNMNDYTKGQFLIGFNINRLWNF